MLPPHLVANYWIDVFTDLVERHGLTPADARVAIDAHRGELDAIGIGDLTYHRDACYRADDIAAGWANGYYRRATAGVGA